MRVVVDEVGVRLEEPAVFDRFDVRRRGDVDLASTLAAHGWGAMTDEGAVMVSIDALRAAGPDDDEWRTGLAGMLTFARSKGWLDDTGDHVRAHVIDEPSN